MTPPSPNPAYPPERVLPGAMARLLAEDWHAMTEAARASSRHTSSIERWIDEARRANPRLDDDQAYRLAQMLRRQHYQRMGRLSGAARRRRG